MERGHIQELMVLGKATVVSMKELSKGGFKLQVAEVSGKFFIAPPTQMFVNMALDFNAGKIVTIEF